MTPRQTYATSALFVHNYTPHQLDQPFNTLRFCFSDSTPAELPTSLCVNHAFTAFNIYPTSATSLLINDILWRTARSAHYTPIHPTLFDASIFIIGLTPELHDFLTKVTLPQMHQAIIDFLVLLHHQLTCDGDTQGLSRLRQELIPSVWTQVAANIGAFENGEPTDAKRSQILEHIVQISFMTPWRVDVFAAYQPHAATHTPVDAPCARVMLNMYHDWRVYHRVLHKRLRLPHRAVADALERAIHAHKSRPVFEQAFAVLQCADSPRSYLARLPRDVIENDVIPRVVRRACEAIPPRTRRFISLKSLLELSAKFFEEIQLQTLRNHAEARDDDRPDFDVAVAAVRAEAASRAQASVQDEWVEELRRDNGGQQGVQLACVGDAEERFRLQSARLYPLE